MASETNGKDTINGGAEIWKATNSPTQELCAICMSNITSILVETTCQHYFCLKCWLPWVMFSPTSIVTCPLDRSSVPYVRAMIIPWLSTRIISMSDDNLNTYLRKIEGSFQSDVEMLLESFLIHGKFGVKESQKFP